ncbi:MAG: SRPBCC domain-containing protein [Planctomycetes bacterium]|nr:SRPBCC domain-containing protein [Planctomycetota bacterium]
MKDLPHSLNRTLVIRAPRGVVFRFFTDTERFARWWGAGSTIDGRVGGEMRIVYPNGVIARGQVTAFEADRRIVFTYGYENAHPELPPGGSLVTIDLADDPDGTRLSMRHDLPEAKTRDHHVPGWRYHLAVFANVVANEHHAGAAAMADRWFAAWAETDAQKRREGLSACSAEGVSMRDPWSCLVGRDELHGHIANTHVHMPGIRMRRDGELRHCQGNALVAWIAVDANEQPRGRGTNLFRFAPDGRIAEVVGFPG